ncbi:hypothetical protein [Nodularia sp. NIES-3585]|uniref:hypothetical protein n=1 Tax=Nodularia sp. NIES-3585 TaxID=1973477 RepID=UPI000B64E002|nr:hypothetical protein [Nodularia sp. NIES-3585]GAX38353.1 hypothetical protein NIES3585_44020 [Nodularia sp. NIES-3585]
MTALNINLHLFLENLLFFLSATSFFIVVGWAWKHAKPYIIPQPLPRWFKFWFSTVQILGVFLPLVVMVLWGVFWGYTAVLSVFTWYFVMLGLQILCESISLRLFHSVVWVMIPYLYVPYRIWQMYEGLTLLGSVSQLWWIQNVLVLEILLWTANYALNVSQLPRLFSWEFPKNSNISLN